MSKPVILCVDDEKLVLQSLKTQLKSAFGDAYFYEVAEDPDDALEVIDELNEDELSIILIVSDWLMPGMKGDEFLVRVHQKFPNIVKILLTGQADESAIARAQREANLHCCLFKPWSEAELVAAIKSGLSQPG
ncbi:response regulator [Phormidium sp. CCY1219]|uniref:response regulator n=1 Tax=Phormidium sp. CCY1219 TaxID=2886104 RepID=UPI002D1E67D4|nr:response regulator [Phormidium sp. CCY1219]MEB3827089.1 response regulator [Phormidium sp. CCY1219]